MEKAVEVSPQQLANVLRSRRTIGRFAEREVPSELLLEAIEVARWAPNHRLTEPWHFFLLGRQAIAHTIERVGELGARGKTEEMGQRKARRAQGVPAWVVVTSKRDDDPIVSRENYAATCCAIHNFSLFLWQSGLGMKWCTGALSEDTAYATSLGIDVAKEAVVGILRIGYPINTPSQQRRPVADITTLLP